MVVNSRNFNLSMNLHEPVVETCKHGDYMGARPARLPSSHPLFLLVRHHPEVEVRLDST